MDIWNVITAIATAISSIIAATAIYQTVRIQKRQELLERRQLLIPMWDHIKDLKDIDPANPVWMDVHKAVQVLELIGIAWEGQLIDENIIRRMYSDLYLDIYDKVMACKNPPPQFEKDGRGMIYSCPAAMALYKKLEEEKIERGRIKPLPL